MKKITALAVLSLALAACGHEEKAENKSTTTENVTTENVTTEAPSKPLQTETYKDPLHQVPLDEGGNMLPEYQGTEDPLTEVPQMKGDQIAMYEAGHPSRVTGKLTDINRHRYKHYDVVGIDGELYLLPNHLSQTSMTKGDNMDFIAVDSQNRDNLRVLLFRTDDVTYEKLVEAGKGVK